jgi:hypothetical protein
MTLSVYPAPDSGSWHTGWVGLTLHHHYICTSNAIVISVNLQFSGLVTLEYDEVDMWWYSLL